MSFVSAASAVVSFHLLSLPAQDQTKAREVILRLGADPELFFGAKTPQGKLGALYEAGIPRLGLDEARIIGAVVLEGAQDDESKRELLQWIRTNPLRAGVAPVVVLLSDPDGEVRLTAIVALNALDVRGQVKLKAIAPAIVERLADPLPRIRKAAADLMSRTGSLEMVPPLVPLLRDKEKEVRRSAANSLCMLGAPEVVDDLLTMLADPDGFTRALAAGGLGRLGVRKAADKILPLLDDAEYPVRRVACESLGALGAQGAREKILRCLKDDHSGMRRSAVVSVARLNTPGDHEAIASLLQDEVAEVRAASVRALAAMVGARAADKLVPMLKDADGHVRGATLFALGQIRARGTSIAIFPLLKDDKLRASAVEALQSIGEKESIPELAALLRFQGPHLEAVARALDGLGARNLVEEALENEFWGGRATALYVLGELGAVDLVPKIEKGLEDPDARVRGAAIAALSRLDSAASLDRIEKLMSDADPQVRLRALHFVAWKNREASIEALQSALKDENQGVRVVAACGLARMGRPDGVELMLLVHRKEPWSCGLTPLNRLRAPEVWKRLADEKLKRDVQGTYAEEWNLLAQEAGLKLEISEEIEYASRPSPVISSRGGKKSLLYALLESSPTVVLEEGRIRILDHERLHLFWKQWWEGEKSRVPPGREDRK
jgi:HEAT repeat protein